MNLTPKALFLAVLISQSSLSAAVSSTRSANILVNPDFDEGLTFWTPDDGSEVSWVANYDSPPPGSSSLGAAAIFYARPQLPLGLSECIAVDPSAGYKVAAWVIATCSGNAQLAITWNQRPDCDSTTVLTTDQFSSKAVSNDWQMVQSTVVSPDTALGAQVSVRHAGVCNEVVLFDNTFFGDSIFSDSFDEP
jgi:carbohydrate binding protein with CBM4/9 domain